MKKGEKRFNGVNCSLITALALTIDSTAGNFRKANAVCRFANLVGTDDVCAAGRVGLEGRSAKVAKNATELICSGLATIRSPSLTPIHDRTAHLGIWIV